MKLDNRLNAMTVDVEDYFQVSAFEGVIDRKDWDSISLRVGDNTHRLLDLFAENDVKATFFTLGWVAQRCPDVIKRLISEGHELASHGLAHQRATTMTREQLFSDVAESKAILEDIGGVKVLFQTDVMLASLATFIAILVARALMVYPTSLSIGRHWPKGWKHIIFWSGLKGSIPLALVLGLPDGELKTTLVPIAFGVVLMSLLLLHLYQ